MSLPTFLRRWFRGADPQTRRALRRLEPELGRLDPPVVRWYVLTAPGDAWVAVYLACREEADRPKLEALLPAIEGRLREELRRASGGEAFGGPINVHAASGEGIKREG